MGTRSFNKPGVITGVSPRMTVVSDDELPRGKAIKATPDLIKLLSLRTSSLPELIDKAGVIIRNMTRDYHEEVGGVIIKERGKFRVWDLTVGDEPSSEIRERLGFHSHPPLTRDASEPIDQFDEDMHSVTDLMLYFRNTPGYYEKKEEWQAEAHIPRPPIWARMQARRDTVIVFGPHYTVSLTKTDRGKKCVEFITALESTAYQLNLLSRGRGLSKTEEKKRADMVKTVVEANFFPFREHLGNKRYRFNWKEWMKFCDRLSLKMSVTEADVSKFVPTMTHDEKNRRNAKHLVPGTYKPSPADSDFSYWLSQTVNKSIESYTQYISSGKWKD